MIRLYRAFNAQSFHVGPMWRRVLVAESNLCDHKMHVCLGRHWDVFCSDYSARNDKRDNELHGKLLQAMTHGRPTPISSFLTAKGNV